MVAAAVAVVVDQNMNFSAACKRAVSLTEAWRQERGGHLTPVNGQSGQSDLDLISWFSRYDPRPWFRFAGAAGNRLLNEHPGQHRCGASWSGGIWSDAEMPTEVGRQVSFTAYDSYEKERHKSIIGMYVIKCSDAPKEGLKTTYTERQATGDVLISLSVEWTDEQLNAHRFGTNT